MKTAKTLNIPIEVHRELKRFRAEHPEENMTDFAGFAIIKELKERNHKFIKASKKSILETNDYS